MHSEPQGMRGVAVDGAAGAGAGGGGRFTYKPEDFRPTSAQTARPIFI